MTITTNDTDTDTANDTVNDGSATNPVPDREGPDGRSDSNGLARELAPDAAQPQPFGALLKAAAETPGDVPPIVTAQVVTSDGQEVVLIGPTTGGTSRGASGNSGAGGAVLVDVLTDAGVLIQRDPDATATPVTDPGRRDRVLRLALPRLAVRYRETLDTLDTLRDEATDNAAVLSEIRDYVIGWHRDDEDTMSRESLNDFLARFDLPPYRPSVRVEYTITGSYVVTDSTPDDAQADAEEWLRPDLSELDRVEDDTDTYTVSVSDALYTADY